ncbi:hypothetical protein HMPREF0322_03915 [Desulfitobacterium hafniense DP7]|uniref:Uncharacterized protein n=1 Tax=Desulfitobacterium hafniense DP7 TaxID=537010 RepID=G9XSM1_DESHA|nr:hypothetical protein HMPREF0322_03915 [Desulfitobacterium hafniense DP7]
MNSSAMTCFPPLWKIPNIKSSCQRTASSLTRAFTCKNTEQT